MKPWMKILMWFGLGAGIGFFAGEQIGEGVAKKRLKTTTQKISNELDNMNSAIQSATDALKNYNDTIGYYRTGHVTDEEQADVVEDPESPEVDTDDDWVDAQLEIDGEEQPEVIIPLHPSHIIPVIVSEEEYDRNEWGFEEEKLIFYEGDKTLYNTETCRVIEDPDSIVGIGTIPFSFRNGPDEVLDTVFVVNKLAATRFRIERVDACFDDDVSGAAQDDVEEDDDE